MTRREAIDRIRWRIARAFGVSVKRVQVAWDQEHSKPKVTLSADMALVSMPPEQRRAILNGVLADPTLRPELHRLQERLSDQELGNRLEALRARQSPP